MGDQAAALRCEVHHVSGVEIGKIPATDEYIEKFCRWLGLDESHKSELKKRSKSSVIVLKDRISNSNQSSSMRLFRKVSKMKPSQIRRLRPKSQVEAENDRRLSGPLEIT